jgi:hypothetical protein
MNGQRRAGLAWRAALMAIAVTSTVGCGASPRVVTAITGSRDQIKFLYFEGSDQGVVKCKVAGDGTLSACRRMAVVYED